MAKAAQKPERKYKMTAAAGLAKGLIDRAVRQRGFVQTEVVSRWADIVGAELAYATVPIKLVFPRGERMGATLHVRCESAFAPLLVHKAPLVIQQVNGFFGYGAVTKLEVKQGPLPRKPFKRPKEKEALTPEETGRLSGLVGDKELSPLRAALKSLGEYVYGDAHRGKKPGSE